MVSSQVIQITVLLFWLNQLFKKTRSVSDVFSMAGSSRTGLWITMILVHSGQVLELWPISLTTQWPKQCPVSSRCQCIRCASGGKAGWLSFGTLTRNLQLPSTFFAISQMDNCWVWMKFVFIYLGLDVFELLGTFLQNHMWLRYF